MAKIKKSRGFEHYPPAEAVQVILLEMERLAFTDFSMEVDFYWLGAAGLVCPFCKCGSLKCI